MIYFVQKSTRFSPLYNSMIIRTSHGHNLRYTKLVEHIFGHILKLGRVVNRPSRNDCTLTRHESRNRRYGSKCSRIGDRYSSSLVILYLKFTITCFVHQFSKRVQELPKVHFIYAFDVRYNQISASIFIR
ncbi:MAG: Uncharacterised protein [Rhodothermaeota bacterium MED-G12]|nr:MAG: Uncharacterised protein [Rhodothermaeota bacterium MED-G12]